MQAEGTAPSSVAAVALSPARARFQLSDHLKRDAKGAVKTTVKILSTVAAVTQDVPYMGTVSSVIAEILKIGEEINEFKSNWEAVMANARQIKAVVDNVCERCASTLAGPLPEVLKEPFDALEKCLVQTLEVLCACGTTADTITFSQRLRTRARMALNRKDLLAQVNKCSSDMSSALDLFNMKLQIDQSSTMHAMATILTDLHGKQSSAQGPLTPTPGTIASLPSAPTIFHGRSSEVQQIVTTIISQDPARVAILGSGGIGKTSISLAVMHHPTIESTFSQRRYFLSCEASFSAKSITQQLLSLFGLECDIKHGIAPQDCLLSYLKAMPDAILCLDNLETPWDMDVHDTDELLSKLAALPHLTLLITKRGTDRPVRVAWTQPCLPPIEPLPLDAALATWDGICESHDDYALKLIRAVDCVPLAVTLLAHLAVSETPAMLWMRWKHEQTSLLRMHGTEHRLTDLAVSIRLSLCGPRFQSSEFARELLGVICLLPQGIPEARISAFMGTFTDILPDIMRSITLLKQLALLFATKDGYLRVLSPIRHYVRAEHPLSNTTFARLESMYIALASFSAADYSTEKHYAETNLQHELANISEIFRISLVRRSYQAQECDKLLEAVYHFHHLGRTVLHYDMNLLEQCISYASQHKLTSMEAEFWALKGIFLYDTFDSHAALVAMQKAIDLYSTVNNIGGQADCLITMSDVHQRLDAFEQADNCLRFASKLYNVIQSDRGLAGAQERSGRLYIQYGLHDKAQEVLSSALAVYRDCADVLGMANSKHSLGELYTRQRRFAEAEDELQAALKYHRKIGDKRGEAITLQSLGGLFVNCGQLVKAEGNIELSLDLYRELADRFGEASSLQVQGTLYQRLGRIEDSKRSLKGALELHRSTGSRHGEAKALNRLGNVYRVLDQSDKAATLLRSALEISTLISYTVGQGNSSRNLGLLCRDKGEFDNAETYFRDAQQYYLVVHHLEKVKDTVKDIEVLHSLRDLCSSTQRPLSPSTAIDMTHLRKALDHIQALAHHKMHPMPITTSLSDPETGRLTRASSRASSSSHFSSHSRKSRQREHREREGDRTVQGNNTRGDSDSGGEGMGSVRRGRQSKGRKWKPRKKGGRRQEQVPTVYESSVMIIE